MIWSQLARAYRLLDTGEAVAIPTETVYGLAARIDREGSVRKIFALKSRPFFDPLIVHVASLSQARELTSSWPKLAEHLAQRFWPGPLTLILPKASSVNPLITSGLETVAIRMPSHPLARRLLRQLKIPLAAPSANLFGRTSPTEASHVRSEFGDQVFVLDGGPCQVGVESTVVRLEPDKITILRPGSITAEMIQESLAELFPQTLVTSQTDVASPGHLEHHYMPSIPVVLMNEHRWPLSEADLLQIQKQLHLDDIHFALLKFDSDAVQAARELYSSLRKAASSPADFILVVRQAQQTGGPWTAIWDRLERASSLKLT